MAERSRESSLLHDHGGRPKKWPRRALLSQFSSSSDSEELPSLLFDGDARQREIWEEANFRKLIRLGENTASEQVWPLRKNSIDWGQVDSNLTRRVVEHLLDCYEKAFEFAEEEKGKALALHQENIMLQEELLQMKGKFLVVEQYSKTVAEQIEQAGSLMTAMETFVGTQKGLLEEMARDAQLHQESTRRGGLEPPEAVEDMVQTPWGAPADVTQAPRTPHQYYSVSFTVYHHIFHERGELYPIVVDRTTGDDSIQSGIYFMQKDLMNAFKLVLPERLYPSDLSNLLGRRKNIIKFNLTKQQLQVDVDWRAGDCAHEDAGEELLSRFKSFMFHKCARGVCFYHHSNVGRMVEKLKAQVEKLQDPNKEEMLRQLDGIHCVADECRRTIIPDFSNV